MVVSGPEKGKRRQNICDFCCTEDVKKAENVQPCWNIETYASKLNVVNQSRRGLQAQELIQNTTKFKGKWCELGMLRSEQEPNIPNDYSSGLGSILLVGMKIQSNPNLLSLYQQPLYTDVDNRFVKMLNLFEHIFHKGIFGEK